MQKENQWQRDVQKPTERPDPRGDGLEYEHPAFGQISASRVTGSTVLYGSDFTHQSSVRIRIAKSVLRRSLSTDWPYAGSEAYIEVELSEAQWAHFVTAMNVGSGAQCTVIRLMGRDVPGLPDPTKRTAQFGAEAKQRMDRAQKSLQEAADAIQTMGLSKAKQGELLAKINRASQDIGVNLVFVADCFDEHMDNTVQAGKAELEAHALGMVRDLGLKALAASGGAPLAPLAIGFPGDAHDAP